MLPAHVIAEAQRILDAEARRLLADELEHDATSATTTGHHPDLSDNQSHQGTTRLKRQPVPIRRGTQSNDTTLAA